MLIGISIYYIKRCIFWCSSDVVSRILFIHSSYSNILFPSYVSLVKIKIHTCYLFVKIYFINFVMVNVIESFPLTCILMLFYTDPRHTIFNVLRLFTLVSSGYSLSFCDTGTSLSQLYQFYNISTVKKGFN